MLMSFTHRYYLSSGLMPIEEFGVHRNDQRTDRRADGDIASLYVGCS